MKEYFTAFHNRKAFLSYLTRSNNATLFHVGERYVTESYKFPQLGLHKKTSSHEGMGEFKNKITASLTALNFNSYFKL